MEINDYLTIKFSTMTLGPTDYIRDFNNFIKIMGAIGDYWDQQIISVGLGLKRCAITDYEYCSNTTNSDDSSNLYGKNDTLYYKSHPMDRKTRESVISNGVETMICDTGGLIWFKDENRQYAVLLNDIYNNKVKYSDELRIYIISYILGYTDASTISYDLYQYYVSINAVKPQTESIYQVIHNDLLDQYIEYISPKIKKAKLWIEKELAKRILI